MTVMSGEVEGVQFCSGIALHMCCLQVLSLGKEARDLSVIWCVVLGSSGLFGVFGVRAGLLPAQALRLCRSSPCTGPKAVLAACVCLRGTGIEFA